MPSSEYPITDSILSKKHECGQCLRGRVLGKGGLRPVYQSKLPVYVALRPSDMPGPVDWIEADDFLRLACRWRGQ